MQLKIRKIVFTLFIIMTTSEILLYFHYKRMGVNENYFAFITIITFGILMVCYSIQKWKDFINPVSLYFIFIFGFGYYMLDISVLTKPFSSLSFTVIIISIFSYLVGSLINIKFKTPLNNLKFNHRSSLQIFYFILVISVFAFVFDILKIGYFPILRMFNMDVYGDQSEKLKSFVHYFTMLFAVFPSWTYIFYKNKLLKRKSYLIILCFSCFVIMNFLSRTFLLFFLLTTLITYLFYNKFSLRKLVIYIAAILGFFILVGQIRMRQDTAVKNKANYSISKFVGDMAGSKYETNIIESTYILYSSIRYNKFDVFVRKAKYDEYYGLGKYIFRPFISLFMLERIGINYDKEFDVNSAIATYAIDSYIDFGVLGVIIWGLFFGVLASHFYLNYKSGKCHYIISWSIIVFCLVMSPFINYLSSIFVFFVWLINKLIIRHDLGVDNLISEKNVHE